MHQHHRWCALLSWKKKRKTEESLLNVKVMEKAGWKNVSMASSG